MDVSCSDGRELRPTVYRGPEFCTDVGGSYWRRADESAGRSGSARPSKNPDEFVIVVVDTHVDTHAAVVLSLRGQLLGARMSPAPRALRPPA
jgi:hypothetical protein